MNAKNFACCPCRILGSTKIPYSQCCEPLHQAKRLADTAEQLMRSRYTAFVLVRPDYIVKTTLPAQQNLLDKAAITVWATDTEWAGLEIIKHIAKLSKRHAQVEFKAFYHMGENKGTHHELSTFIKVASPEAPMQWYFLDETVTMTVTQKQPCICNSGVKFKRCCGQFLLV